MDNGPSEHWARRESVSLSCVTETMQRRGRNEEKGDQASLTSAQYFVYLNKFQQNTQHCAVITSIQRPLFLSSLFNFSFMEQVERPQTLCSLVALHLFFLSFPLTTTSFSPLKQSQISNLAQHALTNSLPNYQNSVSIQIQESRFEIHVRLKLTIQILF